MSLRDEILEACEKHDAFCPEQLVELLERLPWVEIEGRHYLNRDAVDPYRVLLSMFYIRPTVIGDPGAGKWHFSVDAVMEAMKNYPDNYGSLFRNSVIAGIGKGR